MEEEIEYVSILYTSAIDMGLVQHNVFTTPQGAHQGLEICS